MNVKRYIAADVSEAMIKIKSELGKDAVILHTRKIKKKGIRGWFQKPLVEVVAAIDEDDKPAPAANRETDPKRIEALKAIREISGRGQTSEPVQDQKLTDEVSELRSMMNLIMAKMDLGTEGAKVKEVSQKDRLIEMLEERELSKEVIELLVDRMERKVNLDEFDAEKAFKLLRPLLADHMGDPFTIESEMRTGKIFLFIGPTGVGKTTTLAKLAARLSLLENKSVGLITADTYRIAAVEQLKTYSEILGIPLSVVYEPDELPMAMAKYEDMDYILVDTAGRSHKSEELRTDLNSLLEHLPTPEIFLVISLTTGYKEIVSILKSYDFLSDFKLLFTKLDEAESLVNIVNARVLSGKPLSYFAIGQSVPDDIEVASVEKLVDSIVGEL